MFKYIRFAKLSEQTVAYVRKLGPHFDIENEGLVDEGHIASVGSVQDVDISRTETRHRWFTVLCIGLGKYRPVTYRHAIRREPGEVAMACSTLDICQAAQGRQYPKIKMYIVLTLGLGCERLIYKFVNLCNKHEDNACDHCDAPY